MIILKILKKILYISNASKFFDEKIHDFKVKNLIHFIISNEDILNKIKNTYKK